jgi:hypothetical protein
MDTDSLCSSINIVGLSETNTIGYYEVYNQPNVKLVDINETPIERITPKGIKTVAYLALADNVPSPLSNCPNGMNQPVISPRIRFCGASCNPVDRS